MAANKHKHRTLSSYLSLLLLPVSILLGLVAWQLVVLFARLPAFILPGPLLVFARLGRALAGDARRRRPDVSAKRP